MSDILFQNRNLTIYENQIYKCYQIVWNNLNKKFWMRLIPHKCNKSTKKVCTNSNFQMNIEFTD